MKYATSSKHFKGVYCEKENCVQCMNTMCNCNCHDVEMRLFWNLPLNADYAKKTLQVKKNWKPTCWKTISNPKWQRTWRIGESIMKADQVRSIRLRSLLQMALNGANEIKLREKCMMWGVTKQTEDSYVNSVINRIRVMNQNS